MRESYELSAPERCEVRDGKREISEKMRKIRDGVRHLCNTFRPNDVKVTLGSHKTPLQARWNIEGRGKLGHDTEQENKEGRPFLALPAFVHLLFALHLC